MDRHVQRWTWLRARAEQGPPFDGYESVSVLDRATAARVGRARFVGSVGM
jgi:hypothetical protein